MTPLAARALTSAATVLVASGATLSAVEHQPANALACLGSIVAVSVGWIVVRHRPTSAVGPALAWCSASVAGVLVIDVLAQSSYQSDPLPLSQLARPIWVGSWPLNLAGVFALLLVFPEGRTPGRLWRVLPLAYAAGAAGLIAGQWGAREVAGQVIGTPSGPVPTLATLVGITLVGGSLMFAVGSVVLRYRSGDARRRLQIRWLLLAGSATVGALMLGWVGQSFGASLAIAYTPFLVGVIAVVPLAVGVAMMRYDLFDIDRILGSTASWTLTLLASAAVFGAVVLVVSRGVGASTGLGSTAAAFVTAMVMLPLQRHVAAVVGRVVDRERFVAVAEVEAFAAEVRQGRRAPEEIEAVLRNAQGDPDLRLSLARAEGAWVDLSGQVDNHPGDFAVQTGGDTIARISLGRDTARTRRRIAELTQAGWVPIEVSRLRLAVRDALSEVEASRVRLTQATASERKRLERDLHDGVQQRLVATGMRLRSLQADLEATPSGEIDIAVGELEATVQELRRLAQGVRPGRLDDGLGPALEAVRADCPIPLDLGIGELPELDETVSLTAFLVVSEAVANALKHARATRIGVSAEVVDARLRVEVYDDGVGGVPPLGLTGLRDRVLSLGGELKIDSPDGAGTTIRAVL